MSITITHYEDRMKSQVAAMFEAQYGIPAAQFAELIGNFYDHPYQAERCIRAVAMDGEKVAGFQSFFYWPYELNGQLYRSWQSGNSLVHPDYRGKGIFQQLLQFVDDKKEELGIDFLMGFPVEESYKSFIRNKWNNLLNLQWFVRPVSIFSVLFNNPARRLAKTFSLTPPQHAFRLPQDHIRLRSDGGFGEWRETFSKNTTYYFHTYSENGKTVSFSLRLQLRKKILKELIIGDIRATEYDPELLRRALRDLARSARKARCVTFLSIAVNTAASLTSLSFLQSCGFRMIEKKIYFIVKPFTAKPEISDPSKWLLFRSDIDTW